MLRTMASPPYSGVSLLLAPSLLYCLVIRTLMIHSRADSMAMELRTLLPALGLYATITLVSLLVIDRLAVRRHSLYLATLAGLMALQSVIATLDALSVKMRLTPISWLEYCQFFSNVHDLWPVVANVISPALARTLLLSMLLVSGLYLLLWRASIRYSALPRPLPAWSLRQILPITALLALSLVAFQVRMPVDMKLKPLQSPGLERLVRGFSADLQDRSATAWLTASAEQEVPLRVRDTGRQPFNIVLFVLESTSLDATSLVPHVTNGTAQESTPYLRHLAEAGVQATDTYTVLSHTSKALVGILCGQMPFPDQHLVEVEGTLLNRCLPEVLADGGYDTGFFQAPDLAFEDREGLARHAGFQTIRGGEGLDGTGFEQVNYLAREDRVVLKPAVDWVAHGKAPYLLTIMTSTTHHPYGSPGLPAMKSASTLDQARAQHQVSLRYVDGVLRSLLEQIDQVRGLKNTLVVVVGDHGESFGEHGAIGHDWIPYQEGVHVPLVMWGPDVLTRERLGRPFTPGTRIEGLRQQVDLMPTVLGLLDWQVTHGTLPGQNLFASEGYPMVWYSCADASQCMGMRSGNRTYIQQEFEDLPEVYDLSSDPGEKHDLAAQVPERELRDIQKQLINLRRTLHTRYGQAARARSQADESHRLTTLSKK